MTKPAWLASTLCRAAIACCALVLSGCASPGPSSDTALTPLPSLPIDKLALFSTYPSNEMVTACRQDSEMACEEDMVPPEAFLQAFRASENGSEQLTTKNQTADYELLIANLGRPDPAPWWRRLVNSQPDSTTQFSEFTLSWRGVELSSTLVKSRFPTTASHTDIAMGLLSRWWQNVEQDSIFSASYLYRQLNASNYDAELQLPGTIDTFSKALTELYHDPLEGVISRYTHPEYSEALLDISVYPIRQSLSTDTAVILDDELKTDLAQAKEVATSRALTLSLIHDTEDTQVATSEGTGRRLALQASSATRDTIYASIYVFRLKDKIIKITTTMPPGFSDALVNRAVPHIRVPGESHLMAMLRAKSRPEQAAGGH